MYAQNFLELLWIFEPRLFSYSHLAFLTSVMTQLHCTAYLAWLFYIYLFHALCFKLIACKFDSLSRGKCEELFTNNLVETYLLRRWVNLSWNKPYISLISKSANSFFPSLRVIVTFSIDVSNLRKILYATTIQIVKSKYNMIIFLQWASRFNISNDKFIICQN